MWPFIRPHLSGFISAACLLTLAVAGQLAGPLFLRIMIDDAIPARSVPDVLLYAGAFAMVFALSMFISYIQVMITTKIGLSIIRDLKEKVFRHLLTLSLAYFDKHPSGRLMARVESDTERVRMLFSEVSLALLHNLVMVLGTVAIMFAANSGITFRILLMIIPVTILTFFFLSIMRKLFGRVRSAFAKLSGFVAEYVRTVSVLQIFRATGMAERKMHEVGRSYFKKEVKAYGVEYSYWSFIGACEVGAVVLILLASRGGVISGAITIGTIILFVEYTRRLFWPIVQFSETLNMIQRGFASADRIFGILDTETDTPDGSLGEKEFPVNWHEIRFEDIWFRYGEEDWVLKGVNFVIPRGKTYALVGSSGGGKTTIVSLLLRFYEPTRGKITIDGTDIRDFRLDVWRSKLGLVLQNVSLFSGSLSENLTVFNDSVSKERQIAALETIDASYLLERLPDGIDTEISEGGQNLSMGERQLISLARSVIYDPDILVLDEATSAVDPGTEKRIQKATDFLTKDRTSLIVAHRLSTIIHADRILVIQHGEVVESGNHEELLMEEGIYTGLCRLQLAGVHNG